MFESRYRFSQSMTGEHYIKDTATGAEITFDMTKLSMEDLRSILNGLGNMLTGVSCYLAGKDITKAGKDITKKEE
jgi:hypothetical protein